MGTDIINQKTLITNHQPHTPKESAEGAGVIASVEVNGHQVTQRQLERACRWLVEHRCQHIPEGYAPKLERFRHFDGCVIRSPEELIFQCFAGEIQVKGFAEAFLDAAPKTQHVRPAPLVLRLAGFPRLRIVNHTGDVARTSWSYEGEGTPWLWVQGGTAEERTEALAQLTVTAANAMDRGRAADGEIIYTTARALCESANACNLFGEHSRWRELEGPKSCAVLVLDDLGGEYAGRHELETLAEVLHTRYLETRCTLVSSIGGLSQWVKSRADTDPTKAQEAARSIVGGLCGFQRLTREEAVGQIEQHVINLR